MRQYLNLLTLILKIRWDEQIYSFSQNSWLRKISDHQHDLSTGCTCKSEPMLEKHFFFLTIWLEECSLCLGNQGHRIIIWSQSAGSLSSICFLVHVGFMTRQGFTFIFRVLLLQSMNCFNQNLIPVIPMCPFASFSLFYPHCFRLWPDFPACKYEKVKMITVRLAYVFIF